MTTPSLQHRSRDEFVERAEGRMTQALSAVLEETVAYVGRALARTEKGEGAETEAHNIRAYLITRWS